MVDVLYNILKNQTNEICKFEVINYGCALKILKKLTNKLCKLAVTKNSYDLEIIRNKPIGYVNWLL